MKTGLRWFSYLFHLVLGLSLLAVAVLALISRPDAVHLEMLPWSGQTLELVLLFGAAFGVASVVLAVTGKLRLLFFAWSLAVAALLLKCYALSGYRFAPGEANKVGLLLAASWLALAGAWLVVRQPVKRRD